MNGLSFVLMIKWMVFISLVLSYCYFLGYYINIFLDKTCEHGIKNIGIGFICLLAILQTGAWFFITFSLPFKLFCIDVMAIIIISIMFCIYMKKKNSIKETANHLISFSNKEKIVIMVFACVLILQIIMTFIRYRSDADDSFYVSNSAMFLSEKLLNVYDSSMGNKSVAPLVLYDFQIWEAFLSFLSKVFVIEPVILVHTAIIPFLIICSASTYTFLGKKLFGKNMYANIFYIIISIFHLMGGFSVYSQGSFLLSRIWQGKAIYLNIVLPLLMAWMLELDENNKNKMNYFKITICILAGLALNPTSIYVLGFQMMAMFVIVCLKKRSLKMLMYSVPSIVVYGIFSILLYIKMNEYPSYAADISKVDMSAIFTAFISFFGSGMLYFVLYLISIVIIIKYGSNNSKTLFVYTPAVLLLFVWNPLMGKLIAEHVTSTLTFWRVFWLIPAGTGIAYTIILLIQKSKLNGIKQLSLMLACMLMISLPGKWMFSKGNNFTRCMNVEKIPNVVLEFGNIITNYKKNDNNITLGPSIFNTMLRQKYTNIQLIISRYISDFYHYRGQEDTFIEKVSLNNFIEGTDDGNYDYIKGLLDKYTVKWIIIKNDRVTALSYLCENSYFIVAKNDQYVLLKKK